jgi:hypothetical protein
VELGAPPVVLPLAGGASVVVPTPLVVEVDGGACGSPGLERFMPGVLVLPSVVDGVPRFGSVLPGVPVLVPSDGGAGSGLLVVDGEEGVVVVGDEGVVVEGVVVDGGGVVLVDGESCEMAGLRSVGTPGCAVTAGSAGRTRTRSPSGIPWTSAWPLCGRGPASTKSDAAPSAAR